MDKTIEAMLIKHIEDEAKHQAELTEAIRANAQAIYAITNDVNIIKGEQKSIKNTLSPIAEFFDNVERVGRVGRVIRAIIGWLVLVVGTITMVYVSVSDSVQGK